MPYAHENGTCQSGPDSLCLSATRPRWVCCRLLAVHGAVHGLAHCRGSTIETGDAASTNVSAMIKLLPVLEQRNLVVQIVP